MINQSAVAHVFTTEQEQRLYTIALWLSVLTIAYNILEGLVSVVFAIQDETLSLFGFGVDSFIEVISGIGIAHMILRIRKSAHTKRDVFEINALKITGYSFYGLVAGLAVMIVHSVITHSVPTTTVPAAIIAVISIISMWLLIQFKLNVGNKLQSEPIIADAHCTRVCLMMSVVLLCASVLYEFVHIPYIDIAGTLGIMYYAWREGKECFDKAQNKTCSCSC